jgi:hypothetical protein
MINLVIKLVKSKRLLQNMREEVKIHDLNGITILVVYNYRNLWKILKEVA